MGSFDPLHAAHRDVLRQCGVLASCFGDTPFGVIIPTSSWHKRYLLSGDDRVACVEAFLANEGIDARVFGLDASTEQVLDEGIHRSIGVPRLHPSVMFVTGIKTADVDYFETKHVHYARNTSLNSEKRVFVVSGRNGRFLSSSEIRRDLGSS